MIEIIISACSIVAGATCQDFRLSFMAQSVTPHQCMLYGQAEIAKWTAGHPNWSVQRWRCGARRETAKA